MPIEMDYTFHGANHPQSFWLLSSLNLNMTGKNASVAMAGYHNKEAFEADSTDVLDTQLIACSDPDIFDFYFGEINRFIEGSSYVNVIETYLQIGSPDLPEITTFFISGVVYSPIDFVSAFIGGTDNAVVAVTYSDDVFNGGNFTNGVTVKVNGSPVTVSSAAQPADLRVVNYTLASPVDLTDVVTFEYTPFSTGGTVQDGGGIGVYRIPAKSVTNLVGSALAFDLASNSAHLITLGVL